MKTRSGRVVTVACVVAAAVAATLIARHVALARLQDKLPVQYANRIAALPPQTAIHALEHLSSPELGLGVIVRALSDERPAVRASAQAQLLALVESWSNLPIVERSARANALAMLLAEQSAHMPLDSLAASQGIAHMLIEWPLDGRLVDVAQIIANYERVLSLRCDDPAEIRVADARPEPGRLIAPPAAQVTDD